MDFLNEIKTLLLNIKTNFRSRYPNPIEFFIKTSF